MLDLRAACGGTITKIPTVGQAITVSVFGCAAVENNTKHVLEDMVTRLGNRRVVDEYLQPVLASIVGGDAVVRNR